LGLKLERRLRCAALLVATFAGPVAVGDSPPVPVLPERPAVTLAELAITVPRGANRAVSFTNNRSAFYYTQTHVDDHPEHAWFRGFNLAGRRVFSGYRIAIEGDALDPAAATVTVVTPDALTRTYASGVAETLRLYDDQDVVGVELADAPTEATFGLEGEMLEDQGLSGELHHYASTSGTTGETPLAIAVARSGGLFLACTAANRKAAAELCTAATRYEPRWRAERRTRLERLLNGDQFVLTDDPRLTKSLRLIALTTEQLVTRQRGDGIYAGLPWFPEYWGRDSFISLAGATLVTGRFETARAVLTSFAKFQDLDPDSPFYGRLPNIVKPGSVDYHTTDGTPRFVIALQDYLRYTGDVSLLEELYPNVVASIDGSLARFTDAQGLLVHADNETWMDARREPDLAAYAPRGTRANDIQALWYGQLSAGVEFARHLGDHAAADRWARAAESVRRAFSAAFVRTATEGNPLSVADHVTASGEAHHTLRPNVLFALDLLPAPDAATVTASVWRTLVFPWGVATLDPGDAGFHPYHVAPGCWHKDAAYHNGTVWPWLDGAFIDAMVRFGQVEPAWQLFAARSSLALERGVAGGLPETLDAYPRPGRAEPRLTGTYLQAWSNAEHLRAWYQDFLGVRPQLDAGRIMLRPRLPASLGRVDFTSRAGTGTLRGVYEGDNRHRRYQWQLAGLDTRLLVDVAPFEPRSYELRAGERLVLDAAPDGGRIAVIAVDGAPRESSLLEVSPEARRIQRKWDGIFANSGFARPRESGAPAVRCKLPAPVP
jgi:glycogen debranching enzyme